MTTGEQTTLNAALLAASREECVLIKTQDAVNTYQLCALHPIRKLTGAELVAFAALFSVTVAP